jgi:GNAT superfamily N-acetyltransferase
VADAHGWRVLTEPTLRVVSDRLDSPVGRALVDEVQQEYVTRYGGPDPDSPNPDHLAAPDGQFLVAWFGDEALGCGGIRRHEDGVAEIKRMYTRENGRRRGVARAVLRELEASARSLGYARIVLETGTGQPEAIALYTSSGYSPIAGYTEFADWPHSRCFAKDL